MRVSGRIVTIAVASAATVLVTLAAFALSGDGSAMPHDADLPVIATPVDPFARETSAPPTVEATAPPVLSPTPTAPAQKDEDHVTVRPDVRVDTPHDDDDDDEDEKKKDHHSEDASKTPESQDTSDQDADGESSKPKRREGTCGDADETRTDEDPAGGGRGADRLIHGERADRRGSLGGARADSR